MEKSQKMKMEKMKMSVTEREREGGVAEDGDKAEDDDL